MNAGDVERTRPYAQTYRLAAKYRDARSVLSGLPRPTVERAVVADAERTKGLKHEPKLTWERVNAIRRQYRWHSREAGGAALAKKYGVSANTIHKIIHGRVWRIKAGDENEPLPKLNRPNWTALLQVEERNNNLMDALERLLR